MPPARERFEAHDPAGLQVDQRLVERAQRFGAQRGAQIALERVAFAHPRVHLLLEEAQGRDPFRLGAIECDVGAAQDVGGRLSVLRDERDADAGADHVSDAGGRHRLLQPVDHAQRDPRRLVRTGKMMGEDRELVAADACHHVAFAHRLAEAACDADEAFVARAVTVDVVDPLEAVQVEEQDRMAAVGARRRSDRLGQRIVELAAVRKPGERVVQGEIARLPLGGDAACGLALQLDQAPQREDEQPEQQRQAQRLVELDGAVLETLARGVVKDVIFESEIAGEQQYGGEHRQIPKHDALAQREHGLPLESS